MEPPPSLDEVVELLYQEPTRDPDWFYQRVRCPLFRTVKREAGEPLIRSRVESGAWQVKEVKEGLHLCHANSSKELSLGANGQRSVCVLLTGTLGVQAGARANQRSATILSQVVNPGELVRHFGVAAQLGNCVHREDALAAVYALKDSWVLAIPEEELLSPRDVVPAMDTSVYHNMTLGLMGSLFDALSTNRVIERRLAGGGRRVRFVATMLAVAARHGEVEMSPEEPEQWTIKTNFRAPAQFYKGLARLRENDTRWRNDLHKRDVLEIPRGKGQVQLWPHKLVFPSLWKKFEMDLATLKGFREAPERERGFRAVCRDVAYAAYREEDRPDKVRLARYGFAADCLTEWENHLADVLPRETRADPDREHWLVM